MYSVNLIKFIKQSTVNLNEIVKNTSENFEYLIAEYILSSLVSIDYTRKDF